MIRMLLVAALALASVTSPALATEVATVGDKAVILPWGDWLGTLAVQLTQEKGPLDYQRACICVKGRLGLGGSNRGEEPRNLRTEMLGLARQFGSRSEHLRGRGTGVLR